MKEFLASVNKTPVKTITTKDGDVFDCVDIYKQPSLDHPLLRDHVVQLEPPYPPMEKLRRPSSYITMITENEGEEDACPLGTVPMTRVHMEDLLKFGSVENYNSKYGRSGYNPLGQRRDKHQASYAVKSTRGGPFYGTQVTMNVCNPVIDTYHHQAFSLATKKAKIWTLWKLDGMFIQHFMGAVLLLAYSFTLQGIIMALEAAITASVDSFKYTTKMTPLEIGGSGTKTATGTHQSGIGRKNSSRIWIKDQTELIGEEKPPPTLARAQLMFQWGVVISLLKATKRQLI
ncbi:hypothetical protein H6P81_017167 [Aristolochia fimbriata]|uniref:Neprosin activation peptide domain-containing protein n=1 Tax=Aristolochia fimbriata TaxID=158543 RepID=A0AAV7DYF5_ARIFI|nr:hypothetical protein H6P81_017167 [Aristolochia fimbriata]